MGYGVATVYVEAENDVDQIPDHVFIESVGYIAIKAYPTTTDFSRLEERPFVEYHFAAKTSGTYRMKFYLAASTPVVFTGEQFIAYSVNEESVQIVNTVMEPDQPFFLSGQWSREAFDNIKIVEVETECVCGVNCLKFFGMSPAIVLERIVLYRKGGKLPESYLGPGESYIKGCDINENEKSIELERHEGC